MIKFTPILFTPVNEHRLPTERETGWAPEMVPDISEASRISCLCCKSKPRSPSLQLSYYIAWATTAPLYAHKCAI